MGSMKVLFVCRQNVGRSQMAKAFYNYYSNSHDAEAAGTHVRESGQTLQERKRLSVSRNFFVLDVMQEVGIDISQYVRSPLVEEALRRYDLIVSMANKGDTPEWLLQSPNYVYWGVSDPRGQDFAATAVVRDEIKTKVLNLIENPLR